MAATDLLSDLVGINPRNLTSLEKSILEVELFTRIYEELKEIYKAKNKDYFSLIKERLLIIIKPFNFLTRRLHWILRLPMHMP